MGPATAGKNLKTDKSPERSFLHDLAAPLMIAQGNAARLLASTTHKITPEELQQLQKVLHSIERMIELVRSRRQNIHEN